MCTAASISGFKTNHSLRVFQTGDKQLIMKRTGHRSIDGVRTYKRCSRQQEQNISSTLNCQDDQPPGTRRIDSKTSQSFPIRINNISNCSRNIKIDINQ